MNCSLTSCGYELATAAKVRNAYIPNARDIRLVFYDAASAIIAASFGCLGRSERKNSHCRGRALCLVAARQLDKHTHTHTQVRAAVIATTTTTG